MNLFPTTDFRLPTTARLEAALRNFEELERKTGVIRAIRRQPARLGEYVPVPQGVKPELRSALAAAGIDTAESELLSRHVPWTRRVGDRRTTYQGQEVDLLSFASDNRERLLLKPNDEYGGKGVVIGWESSSADWASALETGRQTPYVVQERVHIAYEPYPDYVDGRLQLGRRSVDLDPYLHGIEAHGLLTRLSSQTLLNVTHGGGSVVPTLLVRERPAAARGDGP